MFKLLLKWVIYAILIMITAWLIPGINVDNFSTAMLVSVVMGLINILIKPIVTFITLPVNFLTLGLFAFIVNALLFMLAGVITPGFHVEGFFSALIGSIILSLFSNAVNKI